MSLTFGARYETYSVPAEVHDRISTLVDVVRDTAFQVGGARTSSYDQRLVVTSPSFPGLLQAGSTASTDSSLDVMEYRPTQPYVMHSSLPSSGNSAPARLRS